MSSFHKLKSTLRVTKEVVKLIWETSPRYTVYTVLILIAVSLSPLIQWNNDDQSITFK